MPTLLELAEACEAAEDFDRQLDRDIGLAIGGWTLWEHKTYGTMITAGECSYPDNPGAMYPSPTEELHETMKFIPEGWKWQISNRARAPHAGRAYIHNNEIKFSGSNVAAGYNHKYRGFETTAATPALALCAVCLRAHASSI